MNTDNDPLRAARGIIHWTFASLAGWIIAGLVLLFCSGCSLVLPQFENSHAPTGRVGPFTRVTECDRIGWTGPNYEQRKRLYRWRHV